MATATYIKPEQLRVGLYVRLDLDWVAHPFTFSSFLLKSQDQVDTLKSLGLEQIRIIPARSTVDPLPAQAQPDEAVSEAAPAPSVSPAIQATLDAKIARLERVAQQRQVINECEKKFQMTARAVRNVTRNAFARPQESMQEASQVVDGMLDSMMTDRDIAIHLVNDKVAGEDVYQHVLNVAVLAMMLGKQQGLSRDDMRHLGLGALFHDIGKLQVPENIVRKTEPLTLPEQDMLDRHVLFGLDTGKKMELPAETLTIILQHHEFVDGSGFPRCLKGPELTALSKIVSIVNAYDNLCNKPNPAESLTPYEALVLMFSQHRARFDAAPLTLFIRCMGVYPPGTLVQLSNNALGLVMAVNASQPLKPCVLIYDPNTPKHEAVILDLDTEPELQIIKSIRAAQLPQQVFDYLNPRRRMTYYFDTPPRA